MEIKRYRKRISALRMERSSFDSHWRDLGENFFPRRTRFSTSERNRGNRKNDRIYNETPIVAARTLASGIMAGLTSPARPWFRLQMTDSKLMEFHQVRVWLAACEQWLRDAFLRSNFYTAIHEVYGNLGVFGTDSLFIEEDEEDIIRCTVVPLGAYWLADDADGRVNAVYREAVMTVEQLVGRFGLAAVSENVARAWKEGNYDQPVTVWHVVEPNRQVQPDKVDRAGMPWTSVWFEDGASDHDKPLAVRGFRERPFMCPRWTVRSEDIYGSSPAMDALGASRQLQKLEMRLGQVLEKIVNPPMHGPRGVQQAGPSTQAGAYTFYDAGGGSHKFEPSHMVDARALQLGEEIRRTEERISSTMYATLFLLLTATGRPNMTAREVEERHEEKILQIGPVIERMQDELLDPAVHRTFAIMERRGLLPIPPREIQDQEWKVEYISILGQAQKLLGTLGLEKLLMYARQMFDMAPESIDRLDSEKLLALYADALGTPPEAIRSEDAVEEVRRKRQEAAATAPDANAQNARALRDLAQAQQQGGGDDLIRAMGGGVA